MKIVSVKEIFKGVFVVTDELGTERLATRNLVAGVSVYGERLMNFQGVEYREWVPYRSKLAAAIINGLKDIRISEGDRILYLGIASGTTSSHISDIIGPKGIIYGIEFAPRPMRDLVAVAQKRKNIIPLLKDARKPYEYAYIIGESVDGIYADIAQPDQSEIFIRNCRMFVRTNGYGFIAIKARSIDVARPPEKIFEEQKKILESNGFRIEEEIRLDPYAKDHIMFIGRWKP
ncbi:MAG: fibrillarin-like rRNA/tRNA 2'-O-methyltransferase [Crenarchaeota archaeon]|nr:fibrillarin-like rRNA/tRNA 2'-O-methyltransferase [Thermoproteota archaeon]MCR8454236.1 fibrillarin-like rRNA/tRNA 2'-O-methyltransferase [Thermoproteota archaeon]MCR8454748.1 fibrillarin-like rRNA/tRNA 2'-O-methyltransferase [Thermoproteota archaeon]MCR8470259.1 fibrillarin-like rRNA/tRNA 2'-O-methyltransferase [Thermoproteota archaeon]MCR8472100.1 fibrillarin-like rRNA/tRNA 2'-O-methyltransferase [Thermoproteota archaeon]